MLTLDLQAHLVVVGRQVLQVQNQLHQAHLQNQPVSLQALAVVHLISHRSLVQNRQQATVTVQAQVLFLMLVTLQDRQHQQK